MAKITALLVSLFCCLYTSGALSHPHNWIDLSSDFKLSDTAELEGIEQLWQFDQFYSMILQADLLNEYGDQATGLAKTADKLIDNLQDHQYFSALTIDGVDIPLGRPSQYRLFMKHKDGAPIMALALSFELSKSYPITDKALAWRVFDPTFYIAMNHLAKTDIRLQGGPPLNCNHFIEHPEPSDELIEYAMSLDRTQRDTDGLGESFAETVHINCKPSADSKFDEKSNP